MTINPITENEIKLFFTKWWNTTNQQLQLVTLGQIQIQADPPLDLLLSSPIGLALLHLAETTENQPLWSQTEARIILSECETVQSWINQTTFAQQTPDTFWQTPIGYLILNARLWAEQDRLVSLKEAAELSGLSLSSLSQRISRGQMQFWRDPNEANPQRARRIRLSELEMFIHAGLVRKTSLPSFSRLPVPILAAAVPPSPKHP